MTTFTDKELIKEIKERIGSLDVRDNIERRAYEIALASLEAEPIAWECGENIILFNPDTVEAYAKRAEISPKPLYAASPVSVTPAGWISCSERMPEDGQEVVVQTHSGWRYIAFYESHSGLFYDSPEGDVEYVLVTHWMPLPEPPQEVK
ncbi:DUF551 domain-containing protein [Escherichia coli]|nr:DUF551 domain-containing protein [Escherichia coli]EJM9807936.1 DUF551 domain-containing protein [Escherichia coli]